MNTLWTCSICPELSRIFPTPTTNENRHMGFFLYAPEPIPEKIDLNPTACAPRFRWGLEIVSGARAEDSGFAPEGQYAALQVDDYAVLEFRGNKDGVVTNDVRRKRSWWLLSWAISRNANAFLAGTPLHVLSH